MARDHNDENWKGVQHCRIRRDVIDSFAWRVIGYPARSLYTELRSYLRAGNNGNVNASLTTMKHHGWSGSETLARALYELQAVGLIVCSRRGGVERGSKVTSLYAFTDLDTNRNDKLAITGGKASFAYRDLDTPEKAAFALSAGVEKLRAESLLRKRGNGAKKKIDASDSEAVNPVSGSDSEAVSHLSASENEAVKPTGKPPKGLRQKGLEA